MSWPTFYPRLRKTRPVRVVEAGVADLAGAVVFFASPLAVPLLKAPRVFFLAAAAVDLAVAPFLTAVVVLPSLVSLPTLPRRPILVAGREVGGLDGAAARRVFAGAVLPLPPAELALVLDVVVTLRPPAARDDLAFSTKFDSMLVAAAVRDPDFKGEPARPICDLAGEAARMLLFRRELEDVGDNI